MILQRKNNILKSVFIAFVFFSSIPCRTGECSGVDARDLRISTETASFKTDREGQLKHKYRFYFIKFKYNDNFYSINIPEETYKKLDYDKRNELISFLLGLYDTGFRVFTELFGEFPSGYQLNITFGLTEAGYPFNKIYLYNKTSNIYANFLPETPGGKILTAGDERILLHEIGHALFAIAVGGYQHPRNKAIEEGFVDMVAEAGNHKLETSPKIVVLSEQSDNIEGLSQLDIEISIWGKDVILKGTGVKGYLGLTHHIFGKEFFASFIEVFGPDKLPEFLVRLKATEGLDPPHDYGTEYIKRVLTGLGYNDKEIALFRDSLHGKVKKNILIIK